MRNWPLSRRADVSGNRALSPNTSRRSVRRLANLLRAGYQIGLIVLVLFAAGLWASQEKVDPLTAAQNERVMFTGPRREGDPVYADLPVNQPERLSIYYTGNSQVYAIMDYAPGDANMATHFSDFLNDGWEQPTSCFAVRIGTEANLRMSELLLKSVLVTADPDHSPDVIVAGIVLDGLRWIDARQSLAVQANRSDVRPLLSALVQTSPELHAAQRVVQEMMQDGNSASVGPSDTQALDLTAYPGQNTLGLIPRVESWLQEHLDTSVPLFGHREDLYALLIVKYAAMRNRLLGISTTTRRAVSGAMYQTNMEIIELTLRFLKSRGIHAVLYIAPIRPVQPNPYNPADVVRFRQDLPALCEKYDVVCLDYSDLIPADEWTNYPETEGSGFADQPDFAHFTGRGHKRLGEQLARDLGPYFERWLAQKKAKAEAPAR